MFHVGTTEIVNVEPMDNVPAIAGAPFTADAVTEFTQMLSDGNRIERRFSTSLARDGKGRTRSEQDVAMLGPLVVLQNGKGMNWTAGQPVATTHGEPPRFTVITDPVDGVTYTLDERTKEARRNPSKISALQALEVKKINDKLVNVRPGSRRQLRCIVESLGTRQIEGVSAEGTRIDDDDSGRADRQSESDQHRDRAMVLEGTADGRAHHAARPALGRHGLSPDEHRPRRAAARSLHRPV